MSTLVTLHHAGPDVRQPANVIMVAADVMMTSFYVLLVASWREFTGHRWIPPTKASDAELWCFFFIYAWTNGCANNRDAGDLNAIAPIMTSL